ncbi:equilibrative nucleotide transporter 3 [Physcomitrium patens]|uniref:Equilibrative nucleoside transporter n=1 Tax=Physcomitrium patens TaxID=3218 RepID=A9SWM8_PHYPA|nr:equilibrative nucleotide transporter 3-like [Physcomitrium patens]PNR27832.1 hypothetical protein PHYPA_029984 [Physcomitrium patens]|eukprot:XP_024364887.1 equilibrative nucleotide transporter 3-like [Physcomitrella patens]
MAIMTQKKDDHFKGLVVTWLLGLTFLFPWNSILTIGDYYYALFPDYHPSRVFTLLYQLLSLIATLIFTWYEANVSTRLRVLFGYGPYAILLLLFIIIDVSTSGHGGIGPYVGVCVLVAGIGIADGVAQGAIVGDLSFMDPTYIQAYSAGLAMSGLVTSGMRFITKAAFRDSQSGLRKGALTFFAIATFVEVAGFVLYAFVFPKLNTIKGYRISAKNQGARTVKDDLDAAGLEADRDGEPGKPPTRLTVRQLGVRIWDYLIGQIILYMVSLSIFPGFLYEDTGTHDLGSWYALVLVAIYNGGDFAGRYVPLWRGLSDRVVPSRVALLTLSAARVAFVPFFYVTAKRGDAGWMMALCALLGLTGGWLSVLGFMRAPRGFSGPEQNAIGNLMILALIFGLTLGVLSGWLWLIGKGW